MMYIIQLSKADDDYIICVDKILSEWLTDLKSWTGSC